MAAAGLFAGAIPAQAEMYADIAVSRAGTALGTIRIELAYEQAPRAVANFAGLASGERAWIDPATGQVRENTPFYDGVIFHRLIHSFVLQGGDRLGTGTNGPGYKWQDDFHPDQLHDTAYKLSMAHAGTNTNGSQFFITLAPATALDYLHSVFGEVVDHPDVPGSRALVDSFTNSSNFPTGAGDRPVQEIVMDSVTIVRTEDDPAAQAFDFNDPAHNLPVVQPVAPEVTVDRESAQNTFTMTWEGSKFHEAFIDLSPTLEAFGRPEADRIYLQGPTDDALESVTAIISTDAYFGRVNLVDYFGAWVNAPANLAAVDSQLTLTRSAGVGGSLSHTLTFDGAGGGSYVDVTGQTGTLTAVNWSDLVIQAGVGSTNATASVPRGTLTFTADPAINGRSDWVVDLNFLDASSGRFDAKDGPPFPDSTVSRDHWRGIFTYTP